MYLFLKLLSRADMAGEWVECSLHDLGKVITKINISGEAS